MRTPAEARYQQAIISVGKAKVLAKQLIETLEEARQMGPHPFLTEAKRDATIAQMWLERVAYEGPEDETVRA